METSVIHEICQSASCLLRSTFCLLYLLLKAVYIHSLEPLKPSPSPSSSLRKNRMVYLSIWSDLFATSPEHVPNKYSLFWHLLLQQTLLQYVLHSLDSYPAHKFTHHVVAVSGILPEQHDRVLKFCARPLLPSSTPVLTDFPWRAVSSLGCCRCHLQYTF